MLCQLPAIQDHCQGGRRICYNLCREGSHFLVTLGFLLEETHSKYFFLTLWLFPALTQEVKEGKGWLIVLWGPRSSASQRGLEGMVSKTLRSWVLALPPAGDLSRAKQVFTRSYHCELKDIQHSFTHFAAYKNAFTYYLSDTTFLYSKF